MDSISTDLYNYCLSSKKFKYDIDILNNKIGILHTKNAFNYNDALMQYCNIVSKAAKTYFGYNIEINIINAVSVLLLSFYLDENIAS